MTKLLTHTNMIIWNIKGKILNIRKRRFHPDCSSGQVMTTKIKIINR